MRRNTPTKRRTEFIPFTRLKKPGFFTETGFLARPFTSRVGATLTEVLMSLLIMSIGVTSVFTLFPIAILRAINATQQTNAKITTHNVEETLYTTADRMLNVNAPRAAIPPDPPARTAPVFKGTWTPGTAYLPGDVVVPSPEPGSPFPSPNLWFVQVNTPDPVVATPGYVSGLIEPAWNVSSPTPDNEAIWSPRPISGNPLIEITDFGTPVDPNAFPSGEVVVRTDRYVVDPLGWNVFADEMTLVDAATVATAHHEFGNKTNSRTAQGRSQFVAGDLSTIPLLRINAGLNLTGAAATDTVLPDSWQEVVSTTPLGVTDPSTSASGLWEIAFPNTTDLTGIGGARRIVMTSTDGSMTVVRNILPQTGTPLTSGIDGQTVRWAAQFPFPTRFPTLPSGEPDVGQVRIENFDRRYTWFLTVRKDPRGNAEIKVVVVFNRRFLPEEEHVYDANYGNLTLDIDFDTLPDVAGSTQVRIVWNSGAPAFEPEPLLKPGNFLFDPRNVEWYRIQSVDDESANSALMTLDRSVISTPDDGTGPPANPAPIGRAILMRGIVDVYDL